MPLGPLDGLRLASLDITDPAVWGTMTQTIVLTLTLVIFILSFPQPGKSVKRKRVPESLRRHDRRNEDVDHQSGIGPAPN